MEAAVLAVLSGAGYQETAREFRVSVSTLYRRVKNLFAVDHRGRPTVFTKFEEESFRKLIQGFESMNLPLTSTKFLQLVRAEASRKGKKSGRNFASFFQANLKIGRPRKVLAVVS